MFQEPDPIGHGAPRIRVCERLASSRVKGVKDIAVLPENSNLLPYFTFLLP